MIINEIPTDLSDEAVKDQTMVGGTYHTGWRLRSIAHRWMDLTIGEYYWAERSPRETDEVYVLHISRDASGLLVALQNGTGTGGYDYRIIKHIPKPT